MKTNFNTRIFQVILGAGLILFLTNTAKAQNDIKQAADSLNTKIENVQSALDFLNKLKISGYLQAQYQVFDSTNAPSAAFSGGSLGATDKRFQLRRGRIKFTYENNLTTYVLYWDVTEKGLSTKEAYVAVKDPWSKAFTLTLGIMNRPFGFEVPYSSKDRETPERARITQTLFPGERDLGAMITFQMPKESPFSFLKLDVGMYNGNGINPETDKTKDLIGHLGISRTNKAETIKYGVGGSLYQGGLYQATKFVYKWGNLPDNGGKGFLVDSTATNKGEVADRQYVGVDARVSVDWLPGITTLRGEYITGKQPGTSSSNMSPTAAPTGDTYIRNISGGYLYLVQNILKSKHQLVVKYDWFDPNTEVAGNDIASKNNQGKSTRLSSADIKYSTVGLGWNIRWNNNVRFMLYYEMVKNETTKLTALSKDLRDNNFTARIQYKF